ncbi:MAG: AAA family ATPase [Clostridiales bacterium]|nr:AAA family ATPase [Clostridiales bacterium]
MCKIISVISCKGGVGKTTSQIINQPTIYDLLNAAISEKEDDEIKAMVHEIICHSTTVDIIPSTAKLSSLETVIPAAMCQDRLIHYVLSFIKKDYDYIFLDCHPGLDVFSRNALAAADSTLIPVEAHILSSDGLDQIEKMIRSIQRHLNSKLKIEGVIITKFQGNTNYCKQISTL